MPAKRLNIETLASLRKVLQPRESRCVADLTFTPSEMDISVGDMDVTFVGPPNGGPGTWRYFDVPVDEYENFKDAASRGTYFNLYIRDQYSNERIN